MAKIKEHTFICDDLPRNSFRLFEEMRNRKELCDITFLVGEESISAHRVILAAVMPHFSSKCSSENDTDIGIPNIEPNAFKCLIQFAYGCQVKINTDNVRDLLSGAFSLGVTEVQKECCEFLADNLSPENALSTRLLAVELNSPELLETTHCYIKENFTAVSETTDFLKLSLLYLKELADENDLNVKNEEEVFSAIMKWANAFPEDRSSELPDLLLKIRMPLIEPLYLTGIVKTEKLVQTSTACRDLVDEARNYNLFPQLRNTACSFRTEPRQAFDNTFFVEDEKRYIYLLYHEANFYVHRYDLLQNKWGGQGCCKLIINGGSTVEFQNNVYFFTEGPCVKFDSSRDGSESVSGMPTPRYYAGATSLRNKIYVCGGKVGKSASKSVECYDPEKDEWEITSSMPTARWGLCAVTLGKHVYTLGGKDSCFVYDYVQRFDPIRKKWSMMSPMLSKRAFAGAAVLNGKIYVCGGTMDLNIKKFTETAEIYDPVKNTWKYISPMNYPRIEFSLLSCRGKLYAIGGETKDLKRIHVSEIYDPEKDEWSSGLATDSTLLVCGAVLI